MHRRWLGGLASVMLAAGAASGQTVRAGGLELDLTGRVQIQFNTTSVTEDDPGIVSAPPATAFETRRLYFGTGFSYDGWLTGLVQADFGGATAALTDGYIDAAVGDGLSVRMGQFKKPFGLFELTSNTKTLTIERAVRIRGVTDVVGVPGETHFLLAGSEYLGRQIGVMVHGSSGSVGYAAGVFNGEGVNTREIQGSKAMAGRVTLALEGPLVVGGAVSLQPTGAFDADGNEIRAAAFALDAEWGAFRAVGLHVMAEAMYGDNPLLLATDAPPTMMGAQVAAAWFSPRTGRVEGLEPVFRLSWADPDTDTADDAGLLLTPGVNLYFTGRNRLMVNAEAYIPSASGVDAQYGLVAQFQVYF
jgi:hypothetical protein